MHLPNRWGPGTIFALSGYADETSRAFPFVAAPEPDRLGLLFRLPAAWSLRFTGEGPLTPNDLDPDRSVCANELLDLTLRSGARIVVAHADRDTLVGWFSPEVTAHLSDEHGVVLDHLGGDGGHLGLRVRDAGDRCLLAVGYDPGDAGRALDRADRGLGSGIDEIVAQRRGWLESLAVPAGLAPDRERLYRKACAILRVNVESPQGLIPCRWTTPDRWPHKNMWLWDSAFHAVGWGHLDWTMAEEAVLAKLAMIAEDGYLAHMSGPEPSMFSVDCTQPPILGWAAERIFGGHGHLDFVRQVYEPLKRYVAWDLEHRGRRETDGLVGWRIHDNPDVIRGSRGGESGWDNSPRFDRCTAMTAVDFSCQMQRELEVIARFAGLLGKADEADEYGRRAAAFREAINRHLWDEETGFYYDRDQDGAWIRVRAGSGFTPLWTGTASPEQAARLVERLRDPAQFRRPLPVATVAADEPTWSDDMWRGPVWLNYNLWIIDGLRRYGYHDLADELAEVTLAEVTRWYLADGTIYEYYDAEAVTSPRELHRKGGVGSRGGVGFGVIRDYGWSATVVLELCRPTGR